MALLPITATISQKTRLTSRIKVLGNYLLDNYSFFNYQSICNSTLTLNKQKSILDIKKL